MLNKSELLSLDPFGNIYTNVLIKYWMPGYNIYLTRSHFSRNKYNEETQNNKAEFILAEEENLFINFKKLAN